MYLALNHKTVGRYYKTHHSATSWGKNLSDGSGGWDVEQVDAGKGSVDYHRQDEDQD